MSLILNSVPSAEISLTPDIGSQLRAWRQSRRRSQLDLALDAGVSTRHLSCVETGKSRPGAALIDSLAVALDLPLRERNRLLVAGGYAPRFPESALTAPAMDRVQAAIGLILDHHEPFPAFVTNRYWDVLMANEAMDHLLSNVRPQHCPHPNILHQVFDPQDMRPFLLNWQEVASHLLSHLRDEHRATPHDERLQALLREILSYPDVASALNEAEMEGEPPPVLTTQFRGPGIELGFFSTLTQFAAPRDVGLAEIRIECMFPADEATEGWCRHRRTQQHPDVALAPEPAQAGRAAR